jgi:DNA-binding Lrp family transcriptional regulator
LRLLFDPSARRKACSRQARPAAHRGRRGLDAYQRFFTERLGELPGVASLRTLISMETVKSTTALPV